MVTCNQGAKIKCVTVSVVSFMLLLHVERIETEISHENQVEINPTTVQDKQDLTPTRSNATLDDVRFLFYNDYRSWKDQYAFNVIKMGDVESVHRSGYAASLPVKILVHGWTTAFKTAFPHNVRTAYLRTYEVRPVNVIVVDWGKLSNIVYSHAVRNSREVGEHVGKFLCWLHQSDLIDLGQTHLIGLSLGCGLIGNAGEAVKTTCGQILGRITGLDPARPGFEPPYEGSRRLRPEDASYVDIVHTGCALLGWGIGSSWGHADFFINGGKVQPNCTGAADPTTCSHVIAASYFSQTIIYQETFGTCACISAETYKQNPNCCETRVVFGEHSDPSLRGNFYLNCYLHGSMEGEPVPWHNHPL